MSSSRGPELSSAGLSEAGIIQWFRGLSSFLDDRTSNGVIDSDPAWVVKAAEDLAAEMRRE